jgi:plastocyanin
MRARRVVAATVLAVVASSGAPAIGAGPAHVQVAIASYSYHPASFTVHVGDTVTWTNDDEAPHTVTAASGPTQLDSPTLHKGSSWSFTASEPGTYHYYCAVHPDMKAAFTVLAAASPQPPRSASPAPARAAEHRTPAASQAPLARPVSSPQATAATTPPHTLDPTLLLVALTCGAAVTALLVLGRKARPTA